MTEAEAETTSPTPVEQLSFEDALGELETIVRDLETGKASLESSIQRYERGVALKQHCEKKLREAQTKIEQISYGEDGTAQTAPLDETSGETGQQQDSTAPNAHKKD
jgi:exodeoxyribonuclease VII small subunit